MEPQHKNEENEKETTEEPFSFLEETIKPRKTGRRILISQLIKTLVFGMLFGLAACCSFFALKPVIEGLTQKEPDQIEIPYDENGEGDPDAQNQEDPEPAGDEDEPGQSEAENPPEQTEPPEPAELTSDNYVEMMNSLYETAGEAGSCIAFVRAVEEDGWIAGDGNGPGTAGLIAANNGRELLILSDNGVCKDALGWVATFFDNSQYKVSLKCQDKTRSLAVFSLSTSSISEETWENIRIAEMGNSYSAHKGDFVFAQGNMLGYGIISSMEYSRKYADAKYDIITTDIGMMPGETGFLFNQDGQVLGVIRDDVWEGSQSSLTNALAISDLKPVLEKLLNGQMVPYIGVYGTTVTEGISKRRNIPTGLYVTGVIEESPAMEAGLQNGDILLKISDTDISGTSSYERAVLECIPGQNVKIQGKRRGEDGYVDIEFTVTIGSRQ